MAAHYGYQSLIKKDDTPGIGMLVSVDTFDFHHIVLETSKIDIVISKTDRIGAFKLFKGEIHMEEKIMAGGHIKVFTPEKTEQ